MGLQTVNWLNAPMVREAPYQDMFGPALEKYQKGEKHIQDLEKGKHDTKAKEMANAIFEKYKAQEMEDKHGLIQSQTKNYDRLAESGPLGGRGSSNPFYGRPALVKHMMAQEEIDAGFMPGSNYSVPLSPEQQQQYSQQNQLAMQKLTTDSGTRKQALFAGNVEQAFENTNVDDLVSYSGPKGHLELSKDKALDAIGQAPERYKKYEEAKTNIKTDAKEIRQLFGASITPEMTKQLDELTNPTSWSMSPDTAKRKIEALRHVITKQARNLKGALTSTRPYQNEYNPFKSEDQQGDMQPGDPPMEHIKQTAKKRGISEAEVLRLYREKKAARQ